MTADFKHSSALPVNIDDEYYKYDVWEKRNRAYRQHMQEQGQTQQQQNVHVNISIDGVHTAARNGAPAVARLRLCTP